MAQSNVNQVPLLVSDQHRGRGPVQSKKEMLLYFLYLGTLETPITLTLYIFNKMFKNVCSTGIYLAEVFKDCFLIV